jgi:hypothetical protein
MDLGEVRAAGQWDEAGERLLVEIDCPDAEGGSVAVWFTRRLLEHVAGQKVDGPADARSVVRQFATRLVREVAARVEKEGRAKVFQAGTDPVFDFKPPTRPHGQRR